MTSTLVVTNDFPTRRGGIESFVLALCQRMPAHEVVVYTASMPGDREFDATLNFPVYRDPGRILLPTPAVGRRVADAMRRHGCDRVLFGASAPLGLLAPRLRHAGARRMVALTHGHEVWWAKVPLIRQLLRRIGDSVDVMTYVSEWCRRQIAPALSARAAAHMQRLSPGVDTHRFHPGCGGSEIRESLGIPVAAPVVVCTARMVKRKGQEALVRAWPLVLQQLPDARLLLVGDGPNKASVERVTRQLGVADSVHFVGGVPWSSIPAYTDAGDVFAMPCRTRRFGLEAEAFGIVFLEAQACGLPVLVGDSGGAPETVHDPVCGTVLRPHDSLSEELVGLLTSGRRGRRVQCTSLEEQWGWNRSVATLRQCLELYPLGTCRGGGKRGNPIHGAAGVVEELAGHPAHGEDDEHDDCCDSGDYKGVLDR